jgi:hypothetical protein
MYFVVPSAMHTLIRMTFIYQYRSSCTHKLVFRRNMKASIGSS